MKTKLLTAFVLLGAAIGAAFHFMQPPPADKTATENVVGDSTSIALLDTQWTSRLTAADWPESSARVMVKLNLDRYRWLHSEAPAVLERELADFESLRPSGSSIRLLDEHPGMAGVLVMVQNPTDVADGILACEQNEDRVRIIGSFTKYTHPDDLSRWAAAVVRHHRCIAGLLRRCQASPVEALFIIPVSDAVVAEEYARWLDDVLDPSAMPASDDEAQSLVGFVLAAGPEVRKRMAADPSFRDAFRGAIWPAFARCVRRSAEERQTRAPWELFGTMPHVWDLLKRADGEAMFQRTGLLAADLLYGPDAALPELREKAAQLLLLGNQELVERAFSGSWSRHPQFRRLMLERHLSDDQLLAGCNQLAGSKEPEALLARWNQMSDAAFTEDIGPPPEGARTMLPGYAIYYAAKKVAQGRDVGWLDAVGVAGDAVSLLTLGGGKVLTETGKRATSAAVRQKFRAEAVKDIAKLTSREIAEQAAEKELGAFAMHHALRVLPAELKERLLQSAVVDVTSLVQGGFEFTKRLGFGRESFKKLTKLDARVFMRRDAKVCISLPSLAAGGNRMARFLNATALNGAFDTVARTEPVQDAARMTIRFAKDETERWQQHLACWWSGLATGAFEPLNKQQ